LWPGFLAFIMQKGCGEAYLRKLFKSSNLKGLHEYISGKEVIEKSRRSPFSTLCY